MTNETFHDFCIKTIKKHPKHMAIKMIANKVGPLGGEKIGIEKAEKVYYIYVEDYCIKYDIEKNCHNINEYNKMVMFNGHYPHSPKSGFGESLDDGRLVLLFFIEEISFIGNER